MQWARGFFRLWLVLTALFIAIAGYSYNVLSAVHVLVWQEYKPSLCSDQSVLKAVEGWKVSSNPAVSEPAENFVADCLEYRSVDQPTTLKIRNGRDWEQHLKFESDAVAAAGLAYNVNHMVLFYNADLKSEKEKSKKNLQRFFNDSIVPSLFLLVLGMGLTWALRGFKSRKN